MTTALITGAASGIGKTFACQLAAQNFDLVLVDRDTSSLDKIAQTLRETTSVSVETMAIDLTAPDPGDRVFDFTQKKEIAIDWLVNNAGLGDYGDFASSDRHRQLEILQVNILALVDLTHRFLTPMLKQRSGVIINLGSIASFQPMSYWATYAASKAFVLSFSEALRAEVRDRGVKVLALCPGPTKTPFFDRAHFPDNTRPMGLPLADPETIVCQAIAAVEADKQTIVAGNPLLNFVANAPRFIPREWVVELIERQFRDV